MPARSWLSFPHDTGFQPVGLAVWKRTLPRMTGPAISKKPNCHYIRQLSIKGSDRACDRRLPAEDATLLARIGADVERLNQRLPTIRVTRKLVLAPVKLRFDKKRADGVTCCQSRRIWHGSLDGQGYFHELSISLAIVSTTVLCASLSAATFRVIRRRLASSLARVPAGEAGLYSRPPLFNRLDMEAPVAIDTKSGDLPLLKKTIDGRWMHPEVGC